VLGVASDPSRPHANQISDHTNPTAMSARNAICHPYWSIRTLSGGCATISPMYAPLTMIAVGTARVCVAKTFMERVRGDRGGRAFRGPEHHAIEDH
jgi:hypothetical protein